MFGRKRRKHMNRPVGEGPSGVWVEYPHSGRFDDLPTIYIGREKDGMDVFEILLPVDIEEERPAAMGVALFPAFTTVQFPLPRGSKSITTEISDMPE